MWISCLGQKAQGSAAFAIRVFKIFIPLFGHVASHNGTWTMPVGSHIRKWLFKPIVPLLGMCIPILYPKKSQWKLHLQVSIRNFHITFWTYGLPDWTLKRASEKSRSQMVLQACCATFGRVRFYSVPLKEPVGSHIRKCFFKTVMPLFQQTRSHTGP